jgi:UDP-N-acetylmuramoyl-tripeptide--D-alanyl-D-alanine ligase
MIELGQMQRQRNRELASAVAQDSAATLAIVGRTNRTALLDGTRETGRDPLVFSSRARAADAVLAEAQPGDVVLFENDLPDHYP